MRYVEIINNKPTRSTGFLKIANDYQNKIITIYDDYTCSNNKYAYDKKTNSIILNSNYQAEQAQKEAERISMLSLTAADVERAIYKAKGIDFEDVIALVEQSSPPGERAEFVSEGSELTNSGEGSVAAGASAIDIKALKIELKANNFYRGNPYIDAVGSLLGFTKQQLDEFFETNDYTKLMTPEETTETEDSEDDKTVLKDDKTLGL